MLCYGMLRYDMLRYFFFFTKQTFKSKLVFKGAASAPLSFYFTLAVAGASVQGFRSEARCLAVAPVWGRRLPARRCGPLWCPGGCLQRHACQLQTERQSTFSAKPSLCFLAVLEERQELFPPPEFGESHLLRWTIALLFPLRLLPACTCYLLPVQGTASPSFCARQRKRLRLLCVP